MTPLVDITLVLLIIFMVTTKIVMNRTVPSSTCFKAATGTSDVQVVFSIILAADGRTLVDGKTLANDDAISSRSRARRRRSTPTCAR